MNMNMDMIMNMMTVYRIMNMNMSMIYEHVPGIYHGHDNFQMLVLMSSVLVHRVYLPMVLFHHLDVEAQLLLQLRFATSHLLECQQQLTLTCSVSASCWC